MSNKLGNLMGAVAVGAFVKTLFSDDDPIKQELDKSVPEAGQEGMRVTEEGNLELILQGSAKDIRINTSVVDRGYFRKDWFSDIELEIIRKFERSVQDVTRGLGPRKYSGMYSYSHIDNVVENVFYFASQKNPVTGKDETKIDLSTVLAAIGHDRIEDDRRHREMLKEWYEAVEEGNHERRKELAKSLDRLRQSIKGEIEKELIGYLTQIQEQRSKKIPESNAIKRRIKEGANLIYSLTRFSDEHPYSVSMGEVYQRRRGESPRTAFKRVLDKNSDRLGNTRETSPPPMAVLKWMDKQFKSDQVYADSGYTIGQTLQERLGNVSTRAVEMPAAVRLQVAANSVLPFNFSAETNNDYIDRARKKKYAEGSDDYQGLALLSRTSLVDAALSLLDSVIAMYEKDKRVKQEKPRIDRLIEDRRRSDYYDRVTVPGSISNLIVYDVGGQKIIQRFDESPENRVKHYEMARDTREVMQKFYLFTDSEGNLRSAITGQRYRAGKDPKSVDKSDTDTVRYNPSKHHLWTLEGVDHLMELMQNPFTQYARLVGDSKSGKRRTVTTFLL